MDDREKLARLAEMGQEWDNDTTRRSPVAWAATFAALALAIGYVGYLLVQAALHYWGAQ
jgi:hypothetical protein